MFLKKIKIFSISHSIISQRVTYFSHRLITAKGVGKFSYTNTIICLLFVLPPVDNALKKTTNSYCVVCVRILSDIKTDVKNRC